MQNFLIFTGDHSYILRKHIFRIFGPPPSYVSMLLVLKISQNWNFLTPRLPPYVTYEWSPIVVGDRNNVRKLGKISQAGLVCTTAGINQI